MRGGTLVGDRLFQSQPSAKLILAKALPFSFLYFLWSDGKYSHFSHPQILLQEIRQPFTIWNTLYFHEIFFFAHYTLIESLLLRKVSKRSYPHVNIKCSSQMLKKYFFLDAFTKYPLSSRCKNWALCETLGTKLWIRHAQTLCVWVSTLATGEKQNTGEQSILKRFKHEGKHRTEREKRSLL